VTGEEESYSINRWIKNQEKENLLEDGSGHRIMHCFYELGHLIELEGQFIEDDDLLVIDLNYSKKEKQNSLNKYKPLRLKNSQAPTKETYNKAFQRGYDHLLNGDCYQFNLTYPFDYEFNKDANVEDFIGNLWSDETKRGAYAHATYIPLFDKLFLSNSPECLFQARRHPNGTHLWTMPIKGSLKFDSSSSYSNKWKELINCKKNEAELFMITDLLRNDLSRIERPVAKVRAKKLPLVVPGILHQYSLIETVLSSKASLLNLIQALFPGGSITGAPKKSVMKILSNLEKEKRGFYCGSTIVWDDSILAASINIRSSVIDFNKQNCRYHAGGGITLKSKASEEYQEMALKVESFIGLLS